MLKSVMNLPATYITEHRQYFDDNNNLIDECWLLWYENKLLDAYSTLEEAEQAAREYASKED